MAHLDKPDGRSVEVGLMLGTVGVGLEPRFMGARLVPVFVGANMVRGCV